MSQNFFRRRILQPVIDQLKQGVTPEKIALTIALGIALGIFPIIGSTTLLCLLAGILLKLNQPIIQVVNYLIYPVQILLVIVFVRIGEFIFNAKPISFSVFQLKDEFVRDPILFMKHFGSAGLQGIAGWFLIAPFVALSIYFALLPLIKKTAEQLEK